MELGQTERFAPRPGERWAVKLFKQDLGRDVYGIHGIFNRQEVSGSLIIYHENGAFDGYEWTGRPEPPRDILQTILDGFEHMYESKSTKPGIEEIARCIPHVLSEFGGQNYSGSVDFHKDEIDVKGDGTLWAMAEYEVEYNWTHEAGNRITPSTSDFDVVQVRVKNASFYTNAGDPVKVRPEQANKVLVDYFWAKNLDMDEVLADQIREQAGSADYDEYQPALS